MNVLVLGAYGFIGSEITRALLKQGHKVCGFGRSATLGKRLIPQIKWVQGDLRTMSVSDWQKILPDIDVVVNAAGALQNTSRDTLDYVHVTAIEQLLRAATSHLLRIVQISAAGVSPYSSNEFLRTKAKGDALIMASSHEWVVLRPVLVFGAQAYGGTAILRAQASLPFIQILVFPDSRIQTVSVSNLANATVAAVDGRVASGTVADLAEDQSRSLKTVVKLLRAWQGFPEPKLTINLPNFVIAPIAKIADFLGYLGWRSPLRSNALTVLKGGILADGSIWKKSGHTPPDSFETTLLKIPSTVQERWFGRLYLLLPLAITTLCLFWIASGLIGFIYAADAQMVLTERSVSGSLAAFFVYGGSIADVALGLIVTFRKWSRLALMGMIALSASYLFGASLFAPDMWLDPLGPLVKVFPSIMLATMCLVFLEER